MRFIHTADIHLDSPLHGLERYEGAPVEQIRGASRQAFLRLVQCAIDEEVDFLIIAGDVYDGDWKDYNTGLFFAAQMSRLREAQIPVFIISGNHDAASQITKSLRLPENVRAFSTKRPETVRLEELGVAIHGQSFPKREVTEDISAAYPPAEQGLFNIGILHTSVTGRPGHDHYAPCNIAGLVAKDYGYWALGHVHKREILHENPWIVFPGNIQGRDMGERGAKGCMLITVDDGTVVSVEQRETNVMRWQVCEVGASGVHNTEDVLDLVRTAIHREIEESAGIPLALRVRIHGACEAHPMLCADRDRWIAEVRSCATDLGNVWVEKVLLHTSQQEDLTKLMGRDDPLARLVRSIHEMEIHPSLLDEFQEEWADLKRKLPSEMRKGEELRILDTDAKRQQCLEDVRQLLLPKLLSIPET